ncbi:hypothetical protein, partial [Mesorhizobium sp. M7A.F.Ca.US.005.03.2.1]|uniref:hypothetical protein n=1 Tax=Mesorhizobium sp. M7A.F.Ca.US.005.03.2.1 TaxID=2496737 RepID=UPI0019D16874
ISTLARPVATRPPITIERKMDESRFFMRIVLHGRRCKRVKCQSRRKLPVPDFAKDQLNPSTAS